MQRFPPVASSIPLGPKYIPQQTSVSTSRCEWVFWIVNYDLYYLSHLPQYPGTTVAQCLRCCATNLKVAGSIPAGVSGFFIDIKSFRSHYGPRVDSAFNRNEYQEYFLGVKVAAA